MMNRRFSNVWLCGLGLTASSCVRPVSVPSDWVNRLSSGQRIDVYDTVLAWMTLSVENQTLFVNSTAKTPAVVVFFLFFNGLAAAVFWFAWRERRKSLDWPLSLIGMLLALAIAGVGAVSPDRKVSINFEDGRVVEEGAWAYRLWPYTKQVGQFPSTFTRATASSECDFDSQNNVVQCNEVVRLEGASSYEILRVPQEVLPMSDATTKQKRFATEFAQFINTRLTSERSAPTSD